MAGIIIPKRSHIDLMKCNFHQYVRPSHIYIYLYVAFPGTSGNRLLYLKLYREEKCVVNDANDRICDTHDIRERKRENGVYIKSDFLKIIAYLCRSHIICARPTVRRKDILLL